MRAFIALELPDSLCVALARWQTAFRAACPEARWTRPGGFHLTLKFLGEISDEQAKGVIKALRELERFEKFTVEVKGFGFFPDARRPHVFWAAFEAPPALDQLAAQVEEAMASLGLPRETRPFNPHLTLARFKAPRPQPELQALAAETARESLGSFEVSEFFLWESRLSPAGSEYRKLARFPL